MARRKIDGLKVNLHRDDSIIPTPIKRDRRTTKQFDGDVMSAKKKIEAAIQSQYRGKLSPVQLETMALRATVIAASKADRKR